MPIRFQKISDEKKTFPEKIAKHYGIDESETGQEFSLLPSRFVRGRIFPQDPQKKFLMVKKP
jgi:hypothetical protein